MVIENQEIRRTLQNLLPGSRYATRVRAVSELGQYSDWSEALEFIAEASASASYDLVAPAAPTVQPQINAITVIMNYTGTNDGITTYVLEHSTDNITFSEINRGQIPLYIHQVPPGQTHYYRFYVIDVYGTSSPTSPSNSGQSLAGMSHKPYATVVVAASNSSAVGKENADFICDGIDDHITINAAIAQSKSGEWYGKVLLLEGEYQCGGNLDYVECIEGQGLWTTGIQITANLTGDFITADVASGFMLYGNSKSHSNGTLLNVWFLDNIEITGFSTIDTAVEGFVFSNSYINDGAAIGTRSKHIISCDIAQCAIGVWGSEAGSLIGSTISNCTIGVDDTSGTSIIGNEFILNSAMTAALRSSSENTVVTGNKFNSSVSASIKNAIYNTSYITVSGNSFINCGIEDFGTGLISGNYFNVSANQRAFSIRAGSTRFNLNKIIHNSSAGSPGISPIKIDNDVSDALIAVNDITVYSVTGAFANDGIDTSYGPGNYINGTWVVGYTTALNDLSDVDTTGVTTGDVLLYNGTSWIADAVSGDKNFVHDQPSTATTWTVTHNLGKRVSVTTIDTSNKVIYGLVEYISDNQVTITFNVAASGKAYCN